MKIQIDTKEKTIRVDESVKFDELIKVLNKLLPKEWKTYSLLTGSVIYWPYQPIITYPTYPLPYYTTCAGTYNDEPHVYNVECISN